MKMGNMIRDLENLINRKIMRELGLCFSLLFFLNSMLLKESTEKLYVRGLVSLIASRETEQTGELFRKM